MQRLKRLCIIAYNVNSLYALPRRAALSLFVKTNQPDIVLISETRLTYKNNLSLNGFSIFRSDGTNGDRGTATLIKKNISCKEIAIPPLSAFEATGVVIQVTPTETLVVLSIYNHGSSTGADIRHDLDIINALVSSHTYGLIGGDFNARHPLWQDTKSDTQGNAIVKWLDERADQHSLVVISQPKPTYPQTPSILDFYLATSNLVNVLPEIRNYFCEAITSDSDHEAVKLVINLNQPIFTNTRPEEDFVNLYQLDNQKLHEDVLAAIELPPSTRNLTNTEIDATIENLEHTINHALDQQKRPRTSRDRYSHLPIHIQNLYHHRQRLRKRLQRIRHRDLNTQGNDFQAILSELNCTNIMFRNAIQAHNNTQLENKLRKIQPGPDTFRQINQIIGRRKKQPPTLTTNDGYASTPTEKAEALSAFFEGNFKPLPPDDPEFVAEINAYITTLDDPQEPDVIFNDANPSDDPTGNNLATANEISEIIQHSATKKAAGADKISNFILKRMPQMVIILLTIVMNNCISNCYFPTKWKTAKVVAIPKKGDTTSISGYRPISLLSNISKILEHLIAKKLKRWCTEFNIIPDNQYGFREKHSTLHPLTKFHHDVVAALNKHEVTVACFLDVEKAFDTVWIEGLIYKLNLMGLSRSLIRIIYSFLHSRKFYVQVEDQQSTVRYTKAGVAQGSKLGPVLFNMYTADQPHLGSGVKCCLFADDSLTYYHSRSPTIAARKVESHVVELYRYYTKWGIRINAAKSDLMCLRRPSRGGIRSAANCRSIKIVLPNGAEIAANDKVKYLGVNFTERLKFNDHTKLTLKKANLAFHRIYPLMRKQNGLSSRTKLLLYKQLIRPIVIYGYPIWHTISKTNMKKLEIFERKILRICTGLTFDRDRQKYHSNARLYDDSHIIPLQQYMVTLFRKQLIEMNTHPNETIRNLRNTQPSYRYLNALNLLNEQNFPTNSTSEFYESGNSSYHRG